MPLMRTVEVLGVGGPAPPAEPGTTPAKAAAKPAVTPDVGAVLIAYGGLVIGAAAGILLWHWRDPAVFQPGTGISVFAPLYILAQSIERFIEPFSNLLGAASPDDAGGGESKKKSEALEAVSLAIVSNDLAAAAKWQRVVDRIRRNTAVIAWGIASAIGMVLCGLFGLLMLRMVGFAGVPEEVDIVISGLAVGSGTKPLHDLISNLQQSKEQKEDPPEKQAA
jgi:hypothetical protein